MTPKGFFPSFREMFAQRSAGAVAVRDGRPAPAPVSSEYLPLQEIRSFNDGADYEFYNGIPRLRRWYDLDGLFGLILLVILPVVASGIYFGFVAASRYVSKASFIVVSIDSPSLGTLTPGMPMQAAMTDARGASGESQSYVVSTFMNSIDAMYAVDKQVPLRTIYRRKDVDVLSQYRALFGKETDYGLYRYFQNLTDVSYDPKTGVTSLSAQAFTPADSKAVIGAMLDAGEQLVNRLNDRANQDAVAAAQKQLDIARENMVREQLQLTHFRMSSRVIDPVQMAEVVVKTVATLTLQSVSLKSQLAVMLKTTPKNRQIDQLRSQITAIDSQIGEEQAKLAGSDGSMSPILAKYEELVLKRDLANQIYTNAAQALQAVQADTTRQHVYLERVSGPTEPDYPTEPRRLLWFGLIAVVSVCCYMLTRYFIRDLRMHHGR